MNQVVLMIQKIRALPSYFNSISATILTLIIAYFDLKTPHSLFVFYLIPVSVAFLAASRKSGLWVSLATFLFFIGINLFFKPSAPESWTLASSSFIFLGFILLNERLRRSIDSAQQLMVEDELTGGLSTPLFLQRAEEELHRSHRYKRPITLAYLDCSALKNVRKNHSFKMEKEILRNIAQIMKHNLRKTDLFTRVDDDNFLIMLPEINAGGAKTALQKIQSLIRLKSIASNWPLEFNIGAITFMEPPLDMNAILESVSSMAQSKDQSANFLQHQNYYN